MAGYSNTPLQKKLGIKPGFKILISGEPEEYWDWISPLPNDIRVVKSAKSGLDFIHIFTSVNQAFEKEFLHVKPYLKNNGMIWISWPKKSSNVPTDLNENGIRAFGLALGMVDVKVCAVSDIWSGLKFVYRVKDR